MLILTSKSTIPLGLVPKIRITGFGGMVASDWIRERRAEGEVESGGEEEVRVVASVERVNVGGE